jgi:hypothetical protein
LRTAWLLRSVQQQEDIAISDVPSRTSNRLRGIARKPFGNGKTGTIGMIDLTDPATQLKAGGRRQFEHEPQTGHAIFSKFSRIRGRHK